MKTAFRLELNHIVGNVIVKCIPLPGKTKIDCGDGKCSGKIKKNGPEGSNGFKITTCIGTENSERSFNVTDKDISSSNEEYIIIKSSCCMMTITPA